MDENHDVLTFRGRLLQCRSRIDLRVYSEDVHHVQNGLLPRSSHRAYAELRSWKAPKRKPVLSIAWINLSHSARSRRTHLDIESQAGISVIYHELVRFICNTIYIFDHQVSDPNTFSISLPLNIVLRREHRKLYP